MGFAVSGVVFLVVALKPVINGQPLHAFFLGVGVLFLILGAAIGLKMRGGADPPGS
jgi:hypothetical protein